MLKKATYKWIAPLVLSLCLCAVVLYTLGHYGVAWDEGYCIYSGIFRLNWLKDPSIGTIDKYWREVHEHPPLPQVLAGITEQIFHQRFYLLNRISSSRLSTVIFVFFLTYSLFSFSRELYGAHIAFLVTLSFFFLPRVFYHSHLAVLDYPMTAMWFMVVYAYWKGFMKQKWIIVSSVLLGFALLTKINAVLIYIPILFYWVLYYRGRLKCLIPGIRGTCGRENNRMLRKILPPVVIPPLVFVAFWPWLWKDTLHRVVEYFSFYIHHADIPVYYMGRQYYSAPWHYPFILTLITVPLVVSAPFFIGVFRINVGRNTKTNIFILLNAMLPLAAVSIQVAKYDGVRLFLPAFPFICMVSGLGIKHIFLFAKKRSFERLAVCGYLFLLLLTVYFSIIKIHPYQSSYYNAAVGGVRGAVNRGFEPEYWGNAYMGLLEWMNGHSDGTYWVYMTERDPNIYLDFRLYKESGLLNTAVKIGGKRLSDYLVLLIRQGMFDEEMWLYYSYDKPVFSVNLSGTELANIYEIK